MLTTCSAQVAKINGQTRLSSNSQFQSATLHVGKMPHMGLHAAGIALLASSALIFTPLSAEAAPTLTFASPSVKKTLEVDRFYSLYYDNPKVFALVYNLTTSRYLSCRNVTLRWISSAKE